MKPCSDPVLQNSPLVLAVMLCISYFVATVLLTAAVTQAPDWTTKAL
jgi:hypothetical protein